jgi:hypothetical protein
MLPNKKTRNREGINQQISIGFNQENDLLVQQLCRTVKEFGKFDLVEVWIPNIEKTKIQLISHCSKNTEVRKVLRETYSQRF